MGGQTCEECRANQFCPGGQVVNDCPAHTFSLPGSYKRSHCKCSPGFYGAVSVLKRSKEAECRVCPANFHCPGGAEALPCPANSASAAGATMCQCVAGFFSNELGECQECASGFWCPGGGVMNACPDNSNSTLGAMKVSDCSCVAGFFQPWPADDEKQGEGPHCSACYAGAYCPGGQVAVPCSSNSNSLMGSSSPDQCVCAAGYYGAGSTGCAACEAGYYCPGGLHPIECPEKSLSSSGAAAVAQCACVPGYTGKDGTCTVCPAGSYCTGGDSVLHCPDKATSDPGASKCACAEGYRGSDPYACTACPMDEYCPGDGQEAPCPANSHSRKNAHSARECACAKGFTGTGGTDCTACAAGTYCPQVGGEVRACPANSVSDAGSTRAAQCTCQSGYYNRRGYSNSLAGPDCQLCPAGFYCPDGAKKQCPAKMTSQVGSTTLDDCRCVPGHYRNGKVCEVCPVAHYCVGDADKAPCPGVSTSDKGAVSDAQCKCVAGQYGNPKDATGCLPCEAGSFCPGGTDMTTCPAGSMSDAGMSECRCAAGFYGSNWRNCRSCPANKYCPGGRTAFSCPANAKSPRGSTSVADCLCVKGYMPVTSAETDLRCERCVAGSFCPGDSVVKQCPAGKTSNPGAGALRSCGCGEGYYDSGAVPASNFAWTYDGKVQIRAGGLYKWCIQSSDGSRLSINGQVAANNDGIHKPLTRCAQVELPAGLAAVQVDGFKAVGRLKMRLTLRGPDTDNKEVVPESDLYESSAGGGSGWRVRVYGADYLLVKIPDMSKLQMLGDTSVDKIDVDDVEDFDDLVPGSCAVCRKGHFCPGAFPTSNVDPKAREIKCPGARFSSNPGASSISDCNACRPGYLGTDWRHCTPCPKDQYCPGGDVAMHCPSGSVTRGRRKHSIRHCVCDRGYEPKAGSIVKWDCEPCRQRYYCSSVGGEAQVCPGNASSPLGSTSVSACTCNAGQYDVGSSCRQCTSGYFCSGDGQRSYCGPLADSPAGSTSVAQCKADDEAFFPDKYEDRLPTCELQQCSKTWLGRLMRSCKNDKTCRGVTMERGTLNGWGCKAVGRIACLDTLGAPQDVTSDTEVPKVFFAKRRDLQEKDSVALLRRMGITVPECPRVGQPAVLHQFCSPHARFRRNAWKGLLWKGQWSSIRRDRNGGCDDDVQLCTNPTCNLPRNALSAVDIPSGIEVHLYSEPGFEGDTLVLYGPLDADDKCLGDMKRTGGFGRTWANTVESIKVLDSDGPPPPPPPPPDSDETASDDDGELKKLKSCEVVFDGQRGNHGGPTGVALCCPKQCKQCGIGGGRDASTATCMHANRNVNKGNNWIKENCCMSKSELRSCNAASAAPPCKCKKQGKCRAPSRSSSADETASNDDDDDDDAAPATNAEEDPCCRTGCGAEGPPAPPADDAIPPPADANVCTVQSDGTCKSKLNIRCANWRDQADTWAAAKQKNYLEQCMAQDCVQSLESGPDTPGCRFRDWQGFCYYSSSAQLWCANGGSAEFCRDGGADWGRPPLGTAGRAQTAWTPGSYPYRGRSASSGTLACACMKDCTCNKGTCRCANPQQQPVGPGSYVPEEILLKTSNVGECACFCNDVGARRRNLLAIGSPRTVALGAGESVPRTVLAALPEYAAAGAAARQVERAHALTRILRRMLAFGRAWVF